MSFPEKATAVVVHGAWADGSSWQAVIRLEKVVDVILEAAKATLS